MKKTIFSARSIFFIIFLLAASVAAQQTGPTNSISGFIFDAQSRTPVPDVYVELQTDTFSTIRRIKTDGSGRYTFVGMNSGNFRIKVNPYRTNYMEETEDVEIVNYRLGPTITSDAVYRDFYLKIDKRKANLGDANVTGAVFAQDVPSEARNLY